MPADSFTPIKALFVNHRGRQCGVYQFGARFFAALATDARVRWEYVECADRKEFLQAMVQAQPAIVVLNHHPFTLPWAEEPLDLPDTMICAVLHEVSSQAVAGVDSSPFDVLLCADPTLRSRHPRILAGPRFIPHLLPEATTNPDIFTVGSFGFATPGKGFDTLCELVNDQFDVACIRINMPPHDSDLMVSPEQQEMLVERCRAAITKPEIELKITAEFMDDDALIDFLRSNTINAFTYDDAPDRGISSCTDYALASGRPLAISRSEMFRHLLGANPTVRVDERSLAAIAADGIAPIRHFRNRFAPEAAGRSWNDKILDALGRHRQAKQVPDGKGFNKLLDDTARAAYTEALDDLANLAPEMLERKIPRANIQQAFALDAARRLLANYLAPRILAVGSYEDTAVESLKTLGYRITEVDPQVNGLDLNAFYRSHTHGRTYDVILCVSVLEHVENDAQFIRMIGELLAPGGVAIFTVDFSERYPETGRRPAADHRLYTSIDLMNRLQDELPDCTLYDRPSWDKGVEDFEYEDCTYGFASWVFRKRRGEDTDALLREGDGPAKRELRDLQPPLRKPVPTTVVAPAPVPVAQPADSAQNVTTRPWARLTPRRVARAVLRRLLAPIIRPFAVRVRTFLTAEIRQELTTMRAYNESLEEALITTLLTGKAMRVVKRQPSDEARPGG